MKRRAFLRGMLAAGAAPYVVTAEGALVPLPKPAPNGPFMPDTVQLGELAGDGPNWKLASRGLFSAWVRPGGDYLDADGVTNGPNHYASVSEPPYPSAGKTIDLNVTALVEDLLVENTGVFISGSNSNIAGRRSATPPVLQVVTSVDTFNCPCIVNCWIDRTASSTLTELTHGYIDSQAGMYKFDLSGVTGTLISATLTLTYTASGGATLRADYLKMPPLIHDPARQLGGVAQGIAAAGEAALASHPSVLFYPSFDSLAAIAESGWSSLGSGLPPPQGTGKFPIDPQFVSWSQFGLTALRFSSQYPGFPSDGSSIMSWRKNLTAHNRSELFVRYMMKIGVDAFTGINELGVKLPGFGGPRYASPNEFSYRMEHLAQSAANPHAYGYFVHAYDATHPVGGGSAENRSVGGVCLAAGRTYSIEQRVKMNTQIGGVWQSDGIIEIWVDGVKCYSDTTRKINDSEMPNIIGEFFANFYHGGTGRPASAFHYEFGGVCIATEYIGPPKKFTAATPAWLAGVAVNQWKQIPGTKLSDLAAQKPAWYESGIRANGDPAGIFGYWTGLSCDTRDSTLYGLAGGGHSGYYGNQAIKLKLSVDAPKWEEAAPPSAGSNVLLNEKVYLDGRPAARHSYFGNQFIEARNRAMCFGSVAVSGYGGAHFPNIVSFNPASGLYEADGTYPDCPQAIVNDVAICKDPATGNVYVWRGHRLDRWNQAANTWTNIFEWEGNINLAPQAVGITCVDTRRNRLFVTLADWGRAGYKPTTVTLGAIPATFAQHVYSGDTSFIDARVGGSAITFFLHPSDPAKDCFLCRSKWDAGGRVWRINASTFFIDQLPTSGGSAIPLPDNPRSGAGIYNRFIAVPQLGGIAFAPNGNGDVWFLRTT